MAFPSSHPLILPACFAFFSKDGDEEGIGSSKVIEHRPVLGDSRFESTQTQRLHLCDFFSFSDAQLLFVK